MNTNSNGCFGHARHHSTYNVAGLAAGHVTMGPHAQEPLLKTCYSFCLAGQTAHGLSKTWSSMYADQPVGNTASQRVQAVSCLMTGSISSCFDMCACCTTAATCVRAAIQGCPHLILYSYNWCVLASRGAFQSHVYYLIASLDICWLKCCSLTPLSAVAEGWMSCMEFGSFP